MHTEQAMKDYHYEVSTNDEDNIVVYSTVGV